MSAYTTIRFGSDTPVPVNGIAVEFEGTPSTSDPEQLNLAAAVVGDGDTSHFLRGDGTFAAPGTGSTPYHNQTSSGTILALGVVWINASGGGTFTIPDGANHGDRLTVIFSYTAVGVGNTWTFTITTADNNNTATFTSAAITAAGFGAMDLIWGTNGWCVVSITGGTLS